MVYFDLQTAGKVFGEGGSPIDSLGTAFGVPQCLLDIGKSAALALLPSDSVLGISEKIQQGRDRASSQIASVKKKILQENGIFQIDTENGTFRFTSDYSKNGTDKDAFGESKSLAAIADAVGYATQLGTELYANYLGAAQVVNGILDCVNSYKQFLDLQKGPSALKAKQLDPNYVENQYAMEIAQVQSSLAFIAEADLALENARNIIAARLRDPNLEPVFTNAEIVSGTGFSTAQIPPTTTEPIFRLVFGPPKSKKGQFLLSVDGLYYDSQTGGVPDVTGVVLPEDRYKFEQAANLGGKGFAVSLETINSNVDTIFDLNKIDDSEAMTDHYDSDHFLSVIKNQKLKHVYDLSAQVVNATNSGASIAMISNLKQSLFSTAATYDSKINRRKKQIEIALKAPMLYGKGSVFKKGEVPINDFSYLKDLNLAVAFEKQKKLVLQQAEVSGVVLPIKPKFVTAQESQSTVQMNHLVVPAIGAGAIIYDSDLNGPDATVLSLTDLIVKDELFAIYNFLDGEIAPIGSNKFNVLNCASSNNYNNAQLFGPNPSSVFGRGLAIPKFTGIATYSTTTSINGVGSFALMPDTREFQDWTYNPKGFTFETWAYVPGITRSFTTVEPATGYGVSSFYRLMLACENTGGLPNNANPNEVGYSNDSTVTKGMVVGFTRDRQVTQNLIPSATTAANAAEQGMFFIAPTRSVNASDVSFLNRAAVFGCASGYEVLKCAVPISTRLSSGKYVSSVGSEFMHFSIAVDPPKNEVRIVVDGELIATSSIPDVFGGPAHAAPGIPTFKQSNSFEYSFSATQSPYHINGPKLNDFFTPWVLGGGYTDGNKPTGGFMNQDSGLRSGLNGHLGSVKFYAAALTTQQTLSNFKAQKGFFKNIDL